MGRKLRSIAPPRGPVFGWHRLNSTSLSTLRANVMKPLAENSDGSPSNWLKSAYTYSVKDGNDDFVDPVTQATRLAVNNPDFSPLYANRLRKDKARVPPIPTPVSGHNQVAVVAARPNPIGRAISNSKSRRL
jgi:hypothetical protein